MLTVWRWQSARWVSSLKKNWILSKFSQVFSLERKSKEQEREAKLGERELGELRSSNQYLLERLEQVRMVVEMDRFSCLASITHNFLARLICSNHYLFEMLLNR